jgi:hypothetical protein
LALGPAGHYGGAVGEVVQGGLKVDAAPALVKVDGVPVVLPLRTAGEAVPALAAVPTAVQVKGAGVVGARVQGAHRGAAAVKDGARRFGEGAQVDG